MIESQAHSNGAVPPSGALDPHVLDSLREALDDVSGEFITSLATVYQSQAVELMDELGDAAQNADSSRVSSAAHSLKGSSANVGGNRLADMCAELEYWGDKPPEGLAPRVEMIRSELDALLLELSAFVAR